MEILNKVGRLSAQEMLEKIEKAALINYGLHRYPVKEYFSGNPGKRIVASMQIKWRGRQILRQNLQQ